MLGTSRKRLANKLLRALGGVVDLIQAGGLCEEARWMTRTRMFNIPKKSCKISRTIKSGEFLRSSAARRILRQGAPKLRPIFVAMRQWGVAIPNGAEALVHWRSTIEDAAKNGTIEPVIVAGFDMEHFCNTVEWPAIRASLRSHFPEASKAVEWEQREPGIMVLSGGSEHSFNRGAEQGEPMGSLKAALPLGDVRSRVQPQAERPHRVCDKLYIDDGQLVCAPSLFDPSVRALDKALATIGATWGGGQDVKSSARLVCQPQRYHEFQVWATDYVRRTCKVL